MNTLSWMIYAADVVGRIGFSLGFFGGLGIFASIALIVVSKARWTRWSWTKDDEWAESMAFRAFIGKAGFYALPLAVVAVLLATALPSQRTIYMIAASEAGEAVVTSPDAIEMMGDLKAIIKKRLKDELSGDARP